MASTVFSTAKTATKQQMSSAKTSETVGLAENSFSPCTGLSTLPGNNASFRYL